MGSQSKHEDCERLAVRVLLCLLDAARHASEDGSNLDRSPLTQ